MIDQALPAPLRKVFAFAFAFAAALGWFGAIGSQLQRSVPVPRVIGAHDAARHVHAVIVINRGADDH